MAKKSSMIPVPAGSSVLPKVISTVVVLALLVVVVKHPVEAAGWVKALVGGAVSAVEGLATFFQGIAS